MGYRLQCRTNHITTAIRHSKETNTFHRPTFEETRIETRCPTEIFSVRPTPSTAVGGPAAAPRSAFEKWSTGRIQRRPSSIPTTSASCSSATVASRSRRRRFGTWWCTKGTIPYGPSLLSTSEFVDGLHVFEKIAPPTEGSLTPKKNALYVGGRRPTSSTSATRARFEPAEGAGRR